MKLPWSCFCSLRCLQITAPRQRHDTTAQDKSLAEQPTLLTPSRAADTSASPHLASKICRPAPSRKPAGQHLYFAHSHHSPFLSGTWHCLWPESWPALPGATHVVANATDLDSRQKRPVAVNQQGCRFLAGEGRYRNQIPVDACHRTCALTEFAGIGRSESNQPAPHNAASRPE